MILPDINPADLTPYTWRAIGDLVGSDALAALDRDQPIPASRALAGRRAPAALLARLFLLGEALSEDELAAALPSLTSTDGFAEDASGLRAPFQLVPYQGAQPMWFASDSGQLQAQRHGEDHVMGIGGATKTLAGLVNYKSGQQVLDLGTGCGFHAVIAAKAGCQVVATDVSERALAYAAFNARINGVNVEFRRGSLFEPVSERFDLIVSNPPFVITPSSVRGQLGTMEYRDGGGAGDGLVAQICGEVGTYLSDSGRAIMLANWEISGEDWFERPESWASGLDSVIVQREVLDPAWYVETWLRDGGLRPGMDGYREAYESWLGDFKSRSVSAIGFGFVVLGRPVNDVVRRLHVELRGSSPTSSADYVDTLWNNLSLATASSLPMDATLVYRNVAEHRFYVPGAEDPWLVKFTQTDGYGEEVLANTELAGFVSVCDGELAVGQIVSALATLLGKETGEIVDAIEDEVFHMIRLGMLVHAHEER